MNRPLIAIGGLTAAALLTAGMTIGGSSSAAAEPGAYSAIPGSPNVITDSAAHTAAAPTPPPNAHAVVTGGTFRMTDPGPGPAASTPGKAGCALDVLLASPLSGIAPWVLFSLFATPGRYEEAVCAALGLTLLMLWVGSRRGISVHSL